MHKATGFQLKPEDVDRSTMGSTSGRGKPTRRSRAEAGPSDCRMKLTHTPTGLSVAGEVPLGRYTRGEMRVAKEKLWRLLFAQLETKVAQHLRLPSRPNE